MIWNILQSEVSEWALRNFGKQGAYQPMLGLMEEVGEFLAAREKAKNISNNKQLAEVAKLYLLTDAMVDAIADQCIYTLNLCEICGINFAEDIAKNTSEPLRDSELMGALALASRAILKYDQGIRGINYYERQKNLIIALSVWFKWVSYQSKWYRFEDTDIITEKVWQQVKLRDWKKHPTNAHAFQEQAMTDDLAGGK